MCLGVCECLSCSHCLAGSAPLTRDGEAAFPEELILKDEIVRFRESFRSGNALPDFKYLSPRVSQSGHFCCADGNCVEHQHFSHFSFSEHVFINI